MLLANFAEFSGRLLGIVLGAYGFIFVLRVLQTMFRGMNDFMKDE